jgi:PAS domain-containing protein
MKACRTRAVNRILVVLLMTNVILHPAASSRVAEAAPKKQTSSRKSSVRKTKTTVASKKKTVKSAVPPADPWKQKLPLLAGGLGVLALAGGVGLVMSRRGRKQEAPVPVLTEAEEVVHLRTMLEAERMRQKQHEDLYWKMAMNASDVLYIMHPTEGTVEWYGQIDTMLGYTQNSFPRTIEAWAESIHPEESEKIIALYTEACHGEADFKVEYRMRHRNGAYRDWQHRAVRFLDITKRCCTSLVPVAMSPSAIGRKSACATTRTSSSAFWKPMPTLLCSAT